LKLNNINYVSVSYQLSQIFLTWTLKNIDKYDIQKVYGTTVMIAAEEAGSKCSTTLLNMSSLDSD